MGPPTSSTWSYNGYVCIFMVLSIGHSCYNPISGVKKSLLIRGPRGPPCRINPSTFTGQCFEHVFFCVYNIGSTIYQYYLKVYCAGIPYFLEAAVWHHIIFVCWLLAVVKKYCEILPKFSGVFHRHWIVYVYIGYIYIYSCTLGDGC